MNIQEYISSGIVESYVLGLADPAEVAEFEQMSETYPEVRGAREDFEILLEKQAFAGAIESPGYLKERIIAELELESQSPVAAVYPVRDRNDKVRSIPNVDTSIKWMRLLVAACVVLLVLSTALNFYFFRQYKDYSARYADLLASNNQLAANSNVLQAKLRSYERDIAIMKDRNISIVPMPGSNVKTSPDANSLATVYWDRRTSDVYLLVNHMPEPSTDKQYQLWALVDGKPVDAGVFDTNTGTALVKMKNISKAQGFAITLEKKGGSPSPTMEQLYVLGNVKA